jgi:hypothetical protein
MLAGTKIAKVVEISLPWCLCGYQPQRTQRSQRKLGAFVAINRKGRKDRKGNLVPLWLSTAKDAKIAKELGLIDPHTGFKWKTIRFSSPFWVTKRITQRMLDFAFGKKRMSFMAPLSFV